MISKTDPVRYYSCDTRPSRNSHITKFHVYDFDNTLFKSPAPNPLLFNEATVGMLTSAEHLATGGWWREVLVLRNLGDGFVEEQKKAWEGYWNEDVVELLRMSLEDEEALTIVMTGRRQELFADILKEMLKSKGLYDELDGLMLRSGDFSNTIEYKTHVLVDVLDAYPDIKEVVLYDDRKSQLNGFQKCLNEYTEAVRPDLISTLVPVFTEPVFLDPKAERLVVEDMLERHNELITKQHNLTPLPKLATSSLRKSTHYTSYTLDYDTKADIISKLVSNLPEVFTEDVIHTFKFQVDHIPIVRGIAGRVLSQKLKESNNQQTWKITHVGRNEDHIAVRVSPADGKEAQTLTTPSILPVASKGKSQVRPPEEFAQIDHWTEVDFDLTFNTTVTGLINFKIIHDGGPLKSKKQKQAAYQQAGIP